MRTVTSDGLGGDDDADSSDQTPSASATSSVTGRCDDGRRLLSSSYKVFKHPADVGDRFVAFLLRNERTMSALHGHVLADHLPGSQGPNNFSNPAGAPGDFDGSMRKKQQTRAVASIEIDAFQLISLDPVLGNLTLRYPDTLLELLEDATIEARKVLRRRMEVALSNSLQQMKNMDEQDKSYNKKEVENMSLLLHALKRNREGYEPKPLHARLTRLPPHMQCCKSSLSSIVAADVGTVVQICGTCVRTGPVRMMETMRTYQCLGKGCGCKFSVNADFGTTNNALPSPTICPRADDGECNSTSFAIVPNGSEHADYQEMKVQESTSALSRVGSVPRSILIKLSDDLVDNVNPGDEVVVVGSLHAEWQSNSLGPSVEVMVGMAMRAHSVRVINIDEDVTGSADLGAMGGSGMKDAAAALAASSGNLREKFRREFDAFWNESGAQRRPIATRDYILRAICPKLYGMHAVKLGMMLVLIGGASIPLGNDADSTADDKIDEEIEEEGSGNEAPVPFKFGSDDENDDGDDADASIVVQKGKKKSTSNKSNGKAAKSRRRTQSHILLIGDPGTGKSQFLRFAAALSPRSVLTTGTGSSRAGLTCAAVRESSAGSNGNEFSLEAGALALADRGVCCIDEFGCMSKEDRTSIHEAMEQQTISVAKAGIICKLNARATVVAVMNPAGGIYDENMNLERNSRLGSALLSRFDLIFVMLDQAQCERDENIAHFLLQQSIIPGSAFERPIEMDTGFNDDDKANGHWGMEKLRAYIATIREKFQPTLSPEASELLENHYSLCRQSTSENSLPVTVRFLESMIRLSQAHARLMYRKTVTLDDAVAVILLMECTAAASRGGVLGGGLSYGGGMDDLLYKNPIDTDFKAFDVADEMFEKEKQTLLLRYDNMKRRNDDRSDNIGGDPPYFHDYSPNQQGRRSWDDLGQPRSYQEQPIASNSQINTDTDQWGRQRMSQVASPHSSLHKQKSIRQVMETLQPIEDTPSTTGNNFLSQESQKKVTFSQLPDQVEHYTVASTEHMGDTTNGNFSQSGGFESHSGVQFYEGSQQTYEDSGGFMRTQDQELECNRSSSTYQNNNTNFDAFACGGQSGVTSSSQQSQSSSSSKRRKKRRTAD